MAIPHDAQESLSSDRTPTLSYSLPFYHSIIDDWEELKGVYPLLYPFIKPGIEKVKEYVEKSKFSRTHSLAICKSPYLLNGGPCIHAIISSTEPVSEDGMDRKKLVCWGCGKDETNGVRHSQSRMVSGTLISSLPADAHV